MLTTANAARNLTKFFGSISPDQLPRNQNRLLDTLIHQGEGRVVSLHLNRVRRSRLIVRQGASL